MGNVRSGYSEQVDDDVWWTNGQPKNTCGNSLRAENANDKERHASLERLSERNKQKLEEFKFELQRKHEKRREIIAAKKQEMNELRADVERLKEENDLLTRDRRELRKENGDLKLLVKSRDNGEMLREIEKLLRENTELKERLKDKTEELDRASDVIETNRELRINIAEMQKELQSLNVVALDFEKEREEYKSHVAALKDVIGVSKKMLLVRESQLRELRQKVESIEETLSGQELNILSQDLRQEYERQLQSIRNLRILYEERQRSDQTEKEGLRNLLEETRKEMKSEQEKAKESGERISELEASNSRQYDEIKSLESNLGLAKAECRQYQAELTAINQLFSEILLGFNNSQGIDLDKLTRHLEDHHELLQNIVVNEISSAYSAVLPKVLLDLVHQVNVGDKDDEENKLETIVEESESQTTTAQINSAEEIVVLLPKVWRVLIELLSHQKVPTNVLADEEMPDQNPCYKTVQTPKGPSMVLSVSQTFIRLKDLILEKKALEKETGHLKQLNTHLESRLQDQEKRLQLVSSELNKTWHVVGKLQKQHQLLHTQEKILRYELAQKRKLLSTLREELEYSRDKWNQAREKNCDAEKQWKQLRVEFASRRNANAGDNSTESGFSDERSSDDEPGYETDVSESAATKPCEDLEEAPDDQLQKQAEVAVTDIIAEALRNILSSPLASSAESGDQSEKSKTGDEIRMVGDESATTSAGDQTSVDVAGPSGSPTQKRTLEEILAARDERFKRLEGQCEQLLSKVTSTSNKSVTISNKLDDLHEIYGEAGCPHQEGTGGTRQETHKAEK
ncbi:cilia- and flagella-associated protein 58 [Cylas formicarius]|uniref:cilia- and flagella-associated protein 58 n=1 Tax=Cylas formicarius TaxID=197179 RepID=UPI0029583F46|nr:cilia- and flagella-associated protein 58 [Cylas formicarius]